MRYKNCSPVAAVALAVLALTISTCGTPKKATTETVATVGMEVPSTPNPDPSLPNVYFTSDISPEGLVKAFEALGVKPEGRVAVKISTGESE